MTTLMINQEADANRAWAGSRLLDEQSYRAAEIDRVESEIAVQTMVGKAALHELVFYGAGTRADILARQEALDELGANPTLTETLAAGLSEFAKFEQKVLDFADDDNRSKTYQSSKKAMAGLRDLGLALQSDGLEAAAAPFLKESISMLHDFNATTLARRLRGALYYTPFGVRGREELHWYSPRLRFRPALSGRVALANAATVYGMRYGVIPSDIVVTASTTLTASLYMSMITAMPNIDGHRMKDMMWSRPTAYRGLRKHMDNSLEYHGVLSALGRLDTLVALDGLAKQIRANGHKTVFPDIEGEDVYHFAAYELKNPLLAIDSGRLLVANSIDIGGEDHRLTFLSGPNSGGKSTLCKAVVQNQVLGQMGGQVVASRATIGVADKVAYHVPSPPALEDETGRFGFELARVDTLLGNATTRSLTLLDDCLDGTTHEERVAVLKNVMLGFRNLGGATLFSTHAHELISQFEEKGVGQLLQVEFNNDRPTYRLVPGVSHTSHAERVAELYNFTAEQVQERVRARGVTNPVWF